MDANTDLRLTLDRFYDDLGTTVRNAADLVRAPNGHNADVLRNALLRTLGSVDRLGAALRPATRSS